ncbi:hypothetical protein [Streptomyces sp. NPDC056323]|uniref:hypothetical protein n=1 Tax=unclassified Streptomyces TaxID=2593676 RepID=UPI0035DA6F88
MSHPQSYEILLVPRFAEETTTGAAESDAAESGAAESEALESEAAGSEATAPEAAGSGSDAEATEPGGAIRSAVVSATGETGASGYPRYSGEGVVADIDPETHAVEALLVDGAELSYGLSARVKETDAGTGADH